MSYFGIGVVNPKTESNIGMLWRSAYQLGASFIFTVGRRYRGQATDTCKAWRHVPLFNYEHVGELRVPRSCVVVGIEFGEGAVPLGSFEHPTRALYLLGAEDHGLTNAARYLCHRVVEIPSVRMASFNVAVAGSIVMCDRLLKGSEVSA